MIMTYMPTNKKMVNFKLIKRKIIKGMAGIWVDRKEWKGKSTIEIADILREEAWRGNYKD